MTIAEAKIKYNLIDYKIKYKNVCGNKIKGEFSFAFDSQKIKDIYINILTNEAIITILN